MSKILYPIFKLPNENDDENEPIPTWIKWWMINNYKKRNWVLSEILTGNPLTLENSVETKFYLPPLPRGNSEQVQYSGKNLYSSENISSSIASVQYTSQEDGTILANGTKSGGTYANFSNNTVQLEPGTYSVTSFLLSGTINKSISVYLINATNSTSIYISELGRSGKSFTIEETGTYYLRLAVWDDGAVFTNAKIGFMLVSGSEIPTTFEKYVGGTASPNPSYPQAISNVTGDVEVVVQNKNLFDKDNFNLINGYPDYSSGTIIASSANRTIWIPCKPSTTYTVQKTAGKRFVLYYSETEPAINSEIIKATGTINNTGTSITKTSTDTSKYLIVNVANYNETGELAWQDVLDSLQIEQGSTASTYTLHKEQTFTFPLGTQRLMLGDYLADDGIHHVRKQTEITEELIRYKGSLYTFNNVLGFNLDKSLFGGYSRWGTGFTLTNRYKEATTSAAVASGTFHTSLLMSSISFFDDRFTDLETARQVLIGTIVEMELATEEITPYTTEQQAVYDEIKQAISYDEQTNISGSSDEAQPLFEVQYYMINESESEGE